MGASGSSSNGKPQLLLRITTGQTQSLELFDYQSKTGVSVEQKIVSPSYLIYNSEQKVQYAPSLDDSAEPIFLFRIDGNDISVSSYGQDQQLWRVINQDQQYMLEKEDQIKIGKIKMTFKELVQEEDKELTQKSLAFRNFEVEDCMSDMSGKQQQCRICFQKNDTKTNPLICLCKCSGSVKFIHFECLRDWIKTSLLRRESTPSSFLYSYYQPSCQLCKHPYQMDFVSEGKKYSLIDLEGAPPVPRAVFHSNEIQEGRKKKTVIMIGVDTGGEVTVGRNGTSQVVLKEISVSRIHCALIYRKGRLFIKDKNSKFGTLVRLTTSLPFSSQTGLQLQFQSKLLHIRDSATLGCCCAQIDSYTLRMQNQARNTRVLEDAAIQEGK